MSSLRVRVIFTIARGQMGQMAEAIIIYYTGLVPLQTSVLRTYNTKIHQTCV